MFDRFVSGARPSWKRRAVLVVSLAAHGVLGLGLLVAGLFHVAEIAPPALAIVFVSSHAPAAEAAIVKAAPQAVAHGKRATTTSAHALVQPAVPVVQATPMTTTAPDVAPPGNLGPSDGPVGPGGQSGSDGPGGPDDRGDGDGAGGPGIAMPAPRARNVAPHQLDAQKIAGADPHLPDFVRSARRGLGDDAFAARICVDQAGRVSRVDVLQGIAGADEGIVATLREWRYRAQPIPVCFVSRFVFDVQ
ncbi:MAG TPA: hypothetical protein VIA18_30675 [Polyangia bacterium]|nr:hypothetical protein [Polyangia bacterium]